MTHQNAPHVVTVVIPVYNEELTLDELLHRMNAMINNSSSSNSQIHWQVLLVNDGSKDKSAAMIQAACLEYPWLNGLHFARNFGHQVAISAGTDFAEGDAVIVMDGDLQDPPELLPEMVRLWQNGYDVVYATRNKRHGESWFKLFTANAFYRVLRKLSDVDIPVDTGDFRLMSRRVVTALNTMRERNRFIRGMVSWVGFNQTTLLYERDKRFDGETKYGLSKMLRLAVNGILSFSTVPLQWITMVGFIISGLSFLGIFYVLYVTLIQQSTLPGWSSLMTAILFLGGVQLISLGIVGEYIGRIFDEARKRPLYIVSALEKPISGKPTSGPSTTLESIPQPEYCA